MEALKETPLVGRHRAMGALMAPFGGWEMPIQYEGILAEHRACREKAALFDICHMGEFLYEGDIAGGGLEEVFTFSVASIPVGRSRYGFLLNERGGIVDDLIVFRMADDKVMIVVNASTAPNDFAVIGSRLNGTARFEDISAGTGKLDLQGPLSRDVLMPLLGREISNLPYFRFVEIDVLGVRSIVSRTGYTGELGFEIFLPAEKVVELWDTLLSSPSVKPAGLGSRDLLRLEVGYSLYGNDLDETITPIEAGLESFVNFDKRFVGKEALLEQKTKGPSRAKVAFKVGSRRSPRHNYEIWAGDSRVGTVTSGAFSPMLGCGIGIGLVDPAYAAPGTIVSIRNGNVAMDATACTLPFYASSSLRG
jgi:aminomethyltransferase